MSLSLPKSMQMSQVTLIETRRRGARGGMGSWLAALLVAAVALAAGGSCYNPSILNDGFICAEAGKRCPDGFECSSSNRCHAVVKCSAGTPTPICSDPPKAGSDCNPACQIGCACGRCNVANSSAKCVPTVGTATLGQLCAPTADNCAAGLICLLEPETCGNNVGRCYQHCTTSGSAAAQCSGGRACEIPILDSEKTDTGYRTCGLAAQVCNPIATSNNGCPSAAFGCYLDVPGGTTLCDCPNTVPPVVLGGVCSVYSDCAAGLVCTSSAGSVGPRCRQICIQSSSGPAGIGGCAAGQRCIPIGATYGYCGL
ncbi:MAG TPA: hypothetical protein VFH68_17160 [Polyangia bacterium]|nr:hypothetical protein [Polyangia bacterium]